MDWTQDEVVFLEKNAEKGSRYCWEYLGRSKYSVLGKAKKLKIKFKYNITNDTKRRLKISNSMKLAHSEGRHPGWSINNDRNRRSYPEKFFLKVFSYNEIFKDFTIKEKFNYGKYFIDFLIVELKLIIEIDGEQHYRTKEAIEFDIKRDNYFLNEGFKIYRIKWKDVFSDAKNEIKSLIEFIENINNKTIRRYNIEECEYKKNSFCNCGNKKHKKSKRCMFCKLNNNRKIKNRPSVDQLIKEVNELGYSAVGRKYGVSDNAIRKWIKNGSLV